MARVRFRPMDRELQVLVNEALSPKARQRLIAREAQKGIDEGDRINKAALGVVPPSEVNVDGRRSAPLDTVNPDRGVIMVRWQLISEAVDWIWLQLVEASPVLTGRYQREHALFADGVEVTAPSATKVAREWVFASTVPYARKIERGLSSQAPDGVYQAVAAMAIQRFGNVADIRFVWREIDAPGSMLNDWASGKDYSDRGRVGAARQQRKDIRQPAILIRYR